MKSETLVAPAQSPSEGRPTLPAKSSRLWPAVVLVALFWIARSVIAPMEMAYFYRFMLVMAVPGLLVLLFFGWWWTNRGIRLRDRLYGFLLIFGVAALVAPFCHKSIGFFGLALGGLPIVLTAVTGWLLLARKAPLPVKKVGVLAGIFLGWGFFALIRTDPLNADLKGATHWRWTPTAEELLLAKKAQAGNDSTEAAQFSNWSPFLSPNDWTGFRGPDRDGVVRGVKIADDWSSAPPKLLWHQDVGPAWSSMIVIGERLFTQEQWGQQEVVVCYDAATGDQIWAHTDETRFEETVSGAGPRATPAFAERRIVTVGATGILNCLDAGSGKKHWSHNIALEAPAKVPMWGYSGSPLVAQGLVIVFAGGEGDKNLLAYDLISGDPKWTASAGHDSYSSPELVTIEGKQMCLILGDSGLIAVDPETGNRLWNYGTPMAGAPRTMQAHVIGKNKLLVHTILGATSAVALIDVPGPGETKVKEIWTSKDLKPEFPDLVVHEGHAYGFDGAIFCCIDLTNGKRCWKGGRYGRGQVILLADQGFLLVVSEEGEIILLAANPKRPEELGRFRAFKDKTWNYPVVANSRLYVRNDQEMACYDLQGK